MTRASTAVLTSLFVLAAAGPAAVIAQEMDDETAAQTAAEAWLDLVDAEEYTESWNEAAPMAQEVMSAEQWTEQVGGVRQQLGALQERSLDAAEATTPPNAPPGDYVVLMYNSAFANLESATETVVAMKQEDGNWKVAGYSVQPAS